MSEAASSEVVTQGSSAAAVAARDVPWSENVAAAEAKLAAMAAEGKAPPEPTRRDRVGKQRGEDGRFKAGEAAPPATDAAPAEEATEPAKADKPADDEGGADDGKPVEVRERVKFRQEKREWRERLQSARAELTDYVRAVEQREAALEKQAADLAAFTEAKAKKDPRALIAAGGWTVADFQKALLAEVKDPAYRAREEVERLRSELAERERKAAESAREAAQRAEYEGHVKAAASMLAKTHPGLEEVPGLAQAVVVELAKDDTLSWAEAVAAVERRDLRARYEKLRAYYERHGGTPPTPPPAAKPAPAAPARRAISPGNARSASAEPATAPRTQAERDRAWAEKWGREMAKTMG